MAAINIIGNILYPREYSIGGVSIDTVLSEEHLSEIAVTRNPVEIGFAVTDNIVAQPNRVIVEGVITSSNAYLGLIDFGIQNPLSSLVGNVASSFGIDNSMQLVEKRLSY